ncbi:GAF domain-containing protein, partial [Patescibacteria group bacterium]|nr:GAF domain-containing protein [Patescibacteria group bacterium]
MLFPEKHLAEELVEMIKLTSGKTYKQALHLFAVKSAEISGADRVCIIILNLKKQLVIKAGFPVGAHPINQVIFSEIGESFLKQVMECRKYALVNNPAEDVRTAYMKELARSQNITSLLFMPLYSSDEPLGVLVFDFTAGKRIARENIRRMQNLADLVIVTMAAEYKKRKKEKEWQHSERMVALGENAARTAHSIRNPLMTIGGFSKRAERLIESAMKLISEKYPDIAEENSLNEIFAKLKGYHRIISSDIIRIEKI